MNRKKLINSLKSVAAAFIGVQSEQQRMNDFKHGKLSYIIIAGVLSVIVFISILIGIVNLVIP